MSLRLKRLIQNSALLSFSVVLTVLLLEFAVRVVAPQQLIAGRPDIWVPADSIGYNRRALIETTINTGERTVTLRTDGNGFRIAANRGAGPDRDSAQSRILLMGDSFVEALQVEREKSLGGLLERALADSLGRNVSVDVAGVGGWNPPQYLIATREALRARRYAFEIVVVYLGNDIAEDVRIGSLPPRAPTRRREFSFPRQFSWSAIVTSILAPLNDYAERSSHLAVLIKSRTEVLRMRLGLSYLELPEEIRRVNATKPRWDVAADILSDIRREGAEAGVPVIFVIIPAHYQVDSTWMGRYESAFGLERSAVDVWQPNQLLTAALRQRNVEILDPSSKLVQAVFDGRGHPYGKVDVHLSERGHRLLTESLLNPALTALRGRSPH